MSNPYAKIISTINTALISNVSLIKQEAALCCAALCYADFLEKALGISYAAISRNIVMVIKENRKPCISAMRNLITARRDVLISSPDSIDNAIERDGAIALHIGYDCAILCLAGYLWRDFRPLWSNAREIIPCDLEKAEHFLIDYSDQIDAQLTQIRDVVFL